MSEIFLPKYIQYFKAFNGRTKMKYAYLINPVRQCRYTSINSILQHVQNCEYPNVKVYTKLKTAIFFSFFR